MVSSRYRGRSTAWNKALLDLLQELREAAARTTCAKCSERRIGPALRFAPAIAICQHRKDSLGAALRALVPRGEEVGLDVRMEAELLTFVV